MKKIFLLWVVMAIATTAVAQYNEVTLSPAEQQLELIKKQIKAIESNIATTEKKRDKELASLKTSELRALENTRDEDTKVDISDKYESDKREVSAKYEAELKPLYEAKIKVNDQLANPISISTDNQSAASTTTYDGLLVNPLWKDVNFVVKDKTGKRTSYYLAKGTSLVVSLPAGTYMVWREWNGYMIGWGQVFHVDPGKTNYYNGQSVAFYSIATDHN